MKVNGPGQSVLLLLDVIRILNKLKISYAVIGAFAASFYGVVRASLDADAIISVGDPEDEKRVCEAFKNSGLRVQYRRGDRSDPVRAVINVEDGFHNRVDLLTGIRGMKEDALTRARETGFMGKQVKVIGLEDFIAMKIFAGSPKDIEDVRGVVKISAAQINKPLLRKLMAGYGPQYPKRMDKLFA